MELGDSKDGIPHLNDKDVMDLLLKEYNIQCTTHISPFESYDGQSFYVELDTTKLETSFTQKYGHALVLKISNGALSNWVKAFQDGTELMLYLYDNNFNCPRVVPNKDGKYAFLWSNNEELCTGWEKSYIVRLLTYLPGRTVNNLHVVADCIFGQAGRLLAQIHRCLRNFTLGPEALISFSKVLPWSLLRSSYVLGFLDLVKNPQQRQMIKDVICNFQATFSLQKGHLRKGFIHGDFSDNNSIVSDITESPGQGQLITGIIDFDHTQYTYVIFDIGCAMTYYLQSNTSNYMAAGRTFLTNYIELNKLTEAETSILYYCVLLRFCQTLVYGLYMNGFKNDPYVMGTQERGWGILEDLWKKGKDYCIKFWTNSLKQHSAEM